MRKGTTSTGFSFEFDEARLDDMRFVDVLAAVLDPEAEQFEKISGVSKLLDMLIGAEQKKRLYDHIGEANGGRVPRAALEEALAEIMGAQSGEGDLKN